MIILTILNTIAILFLLFKGMKFYFEVKKEVTSRQKTFLGYRLYLWKKNSEYSSRCVFSFSLLSIRNRAKTEKKEDVYRMLNSSKQAKTQSLYATFSWLKTWEEVKQFEKDYSVVDADIVKELVANFKPK